MSRAMEFLRELAATERRDRASANDNWSVLQSIASRSVRGLPFASDSAAGAVAGGLPVAPTEETAGEGAGGTYMAVRNSAQ
ncbi:MAG TPA: hypothetical protein VFC46_00875 [Humisphaera sp.]|nr:hypothetical protein [Humisphaera sp.]